MDTVRLNVRASYVFQLFTYFDYFVSMNRFLLFWYNSINSINMILNSFESTHFALLRIKRKIYACYCYCGFSIPDADLKFVNQLAMTPLEIMSSWLIPHVTV